MAGNRDGEVLQCSCFPVRIWPGGGVGSWSWAVEESTREVSGSPVCVMVKGEESRLEIATERRIQIQGRVVGKKEEDRQEEAQRKEREGGRENVADGRVCI